VFGSEQSIQRSQARMKQLLYEAIYPEEAE
jgi:hypothetical protein